MLKQKEIEEIKKLIQSGFDIELIAFELGIPVEQVRNCNTNYQNEEIKNLIESGFDLELISFELNIPIEQVKKCKQEMEESKSNEDIKTTYNSTSKTNQQNSKIKTRIKNLRDEYKKLYIGNNRIETSRPEPLSQEKIELIDNVIEIIQEKIEAMESLSKQEKRKSASSILSELKKIEKYQITIAQAEQLYMLMCSENLKGLNIYLSDRIDYALKKAKNTLINKLAMAVELKQSEVNDIEELHKLERKITEEMISLNPISIGGVRSRISNKITAIRQQQAMDRIRNDIPSSIISVITDLAKGNIDISKANAIIDKEAKRRVKSKPNTRFSLTEEQEKKQIRMQIITAIREKADAYHIQYPEKMVLQMQELCECQFGVSIGAVVKNLISKKQFEKAKSICDKFNPNTKEASSTKSTIKSLKNEIRNAEISDIVMTLINMDGTAEDEMAYFELVQKGLSMGNVSLSAISLGKSEDGTRNITLADIWTDEIQENKTRE